MDSFASSMVDDIPDLGGCATNFISVLSRSRPQIFIPAGISQSHVFLYTKKAALPHGYLHVRHVAAQLPAWLSFSGTYIDMGLF